jgi:chemotaxis protein methyltransferase CheR
MSAGYATLKEALIAETGLAYYADKDAELQRVFARRAKALGLPDLETYAHHCLNGGWSAAELDELVRALTIGETYFFRHRELLEAFRTMGLPGLLQRNAPRRELRIWSAGCATGAEAYTMSILLGDALGAEAEAWRIYILGTDINRRFLAQAEAGRYSRWALRGLTEAFVATHFSREGDEYIINPAHRRGVSFRYHNLLNGTCVPALDRIGPWDVILCRNVLIYFASDITCRVLGQFRDVLAPGGWLLVGHAEPNLETFRDWQVVNAPGAVLYQKPETPHDQVSALAPAELAQPPTASPPSGVVVRPTARAASRRTNAPRPTAARSLAAQPAPQRPLDKLWDFMDAGKWVQALKACEQALRHQRPSADLMFWRGLIQEQAGDLTKAEQDYGRALYLERSHPLAHYHLGLLLLKTGRPAPARRSFAHAHRILSALPDDHVVAQRERLTAGALLKLVEVAQRRLATHAD